MSTVTLRAEPAEPVSAEMAARLVEQSSANQPLAPARKTGDVILNVENISLSTTRRAPTDAALAISGATWAHVACGSSQTIRCWTAATFIAGSTRHGGQPVGGLLQHLRPLAAREADER